MSQHARVEEISDSDSDPSEGDIENLADIITLPTRPAPSSSPAANPTLLSPSSLPTPRTSNAFKGAPAAEVKTWTCLYPIYFDASRSRGEGRMVGREHAVANPLAREIAEGAFRMGLQCELEAQKSHPKDWANPGRVRVKFEDGDKGVKNKHHLLLKIAAWLQQNPTTDRTPFKLPVPGATPKEPNPEVPTPRGWKINKILPLHSPAVTGGGVSDNLFKDMMAEMQEGGGIIPGAAGGSGQKKKEKGKKK
ncbi:signal recognition particle, SRP19 subunit [Eremomyces bilateralis CBS 781.70]|uniref:Signal recognition particle, SRP19 subunit n=1 Tax=Eremomyces bilateralis CBS 781.70 TaxID=1392243 RepID=A0A6G1G1C5_9PEZI|nr:signal recognition particle, SRP19 subunit [Eremomyces bilateralis CBS 781.70]KAF1811731.1 signal recognition particle, SRP19 subunit [Eremomyces bilateralis CBS 781.70]